MSQVFLFAEFKAGPPVLLALRNERRGSIAGKPLPQEPVETGRGG